ncbi:MAG: hydroxyacylglutathione hydrolase [Verrucomicrobiota bacterium]|nr:hydroxyacylglutathione hydrolase [Verrucomicrobiota bacterium]
MTLRGDCPLRESSAVKIHVLPSGPIETNGYLLLEPKLGEAVLVDAPGDILVKITPILAKEGCRLAELWLTHGHWDHMQAAAEVKRATGATVRAHRADQALIETPEIMEGFMGRRMGLEGVKVDAWVEPGEKLKALGREFEVRHVPGHCPGNVLFYQAETKVALVGDALFSSGVGRWDLPGGSFEELQRSIREQIYTLPDDTVVLPGHGERTAVGIEKETNPYVAAVIP